MTRMKRPIDAAMALVVVIATPVAAWWLIGDQSETPIPGRDQLDYISHPPEISGWIVTLCGATALGAVVMGSGWLLIAARQGALDERWIMPVVLLALAGVVIAGTARLLTAGSHGANIGGGVAMLVCPPVVIALVGTAFARGRRILQS